MSSQSCVLKMDTKDRSNKRLEIPLEACMCICFLINVLILIILKYFISDINMSVFYENMLIIPVMIILMMTRIIIIMTTSVMIIRINTYSYSLNSMHYKRANNVCNQGLQIFFIVLHTYVSYNSVFVLWRLKNKFCIFCRIFYYKLYYQETQMKSRIFRNITWIS